MLSNMPVTCISGCCPETNKTNFLATFDFKFNVVSLQRLVNMEEYVSINSHARVIVGKLSHHMNFAFFVTAPGVWENELLHKSLN